MTYTNKIYPRLENGNRDVMGVNLDEETVRTLALA